MKQFPRDLKGDERLARARGQRQQNALLVVRDRLHHPLDGDILVVTARMRTAFVFKWHSGEAVAPRVGLREGCGPKLVGRGIGGNGTFLARLHINSINALAVGGVGESHRHLARILFALRHAFRQRFVPRLGFDHGQFLVAIDQHIIGGERLAAFAMPLDTARGNGIFAQNLASINDSPARRGQRGINMLGSGLGFVHVTLFSI